LANLDLNALIFGGQHTPAQLLCLEKNVDKENVDSASSFCPDIGRNRSAERCRILLKGLALLDFRPVFGSQSRLRAMPLFKYRFLYRFLFLTAYCAAVLWLSGCGGGSSTQPRRITDPAPPPVAEGEVSDTAASIIPTLEERVRENPEDFVAYNKLSGYYLQRMRETGDAKYLDLATRAAQASIKILPAENNAGALSARAQVEFAAHDFTGARDHAIQLVRMDPRKSQSYLILVDSLIELGDYAQATEVFRQIQQLGGGGIGGETRLARFDMLRGKTDNARSRLENVLASTLQQVPRERETVAWCRWQLGELAFSLGKYEDAERRHREALMDFPDYYRAIAGLAHALAARGDMTSATTEAERAVRVLPDPTFVAMLGDIYRASEREKEAQAQYALVEQIARLNDSSGTLYNRQLALFYADHEIKTEQAYKLASKEYEVRRDIYGADAVAWTALKAGRVPEAQKTIREALRLGTQDARLFYHAGMIARAAGDTAGARDYLKRALDLSPQFDPVQAPLARKALQD
jgi:tetratricopeptide (TPR) repeat protein